MKKNWLYTLSPRRISVPECKLSCSISDMGLGVWLFLSDVCLLDGSSKDWIERSAWVRWRLKEHARRNAFEVIIRARWADTAVGRWVQNWTARASDGSGYSLSWVRLKGGENHTLFRRCSTFCCQVFQFMWQANIAQLPEGKCFFITVQFLYNLCMFELWQFNKSTNFRDK